MLMGSRLEAEAFFEALRNKIPMWPAKEKYSNLWIRLETCLFVNKREALQKEMGLTQAAGRKLGQRTKASIKDDHVERAQKAGEMVTKPLALELARGLVNP
jgi:hypothetical protein